LHRGAAGLVREGRVGEREGEQERERRRKAENGGRETTAAGGPKGDERERRCGEKVEGNVAPKRGNGPLWHGRGEDTGPDRWNRVCGCREGRRDEQTGARQEDAAAELEAYYHGCPQMGRTFALSGV